MKSEVSLEQSSANSKNLEKNIKSQEINELQEELLNDVCLKKHLRLLSDLEVVPFKPFEDRASFSWYKITKIVYEKEVFFADKLSMLYTALHQEARTVVLVLQKKDKLIDLYLGANDKKSTSHISGGILSDGLKGYMPGISIAHKANIELLYENPSIASVSGIASLRDDKKEKFVQGIERLLNTTENIPTFTAMFIADAISIEEQLSVRTAYEDIYSQLVPFSEVQQTYNEGESKTITETLTKGLTETIGTNLSKTITNGYGENESVTKTEGKSDTKNRNKNIVKSKMSHLFGGETSTSSTTNNSTAVQKGTSKNYSEAKQTGESKSSATNTSEAKGSSDQMSTSISRQVKLENKVVKGWLQRIDKQLERMERSESFGLWNVATYFVANTYTTSVKLANIYKGIITGENSGLESAFVNSWKSDSNSGVEIIKYLKHNAHPLFNYKNAMAINPGSMVNSEELAIHLSLPQSSVPGILVKESASFGRNVISENEDKETIKVGNILHLGIEEEGNKVHLDVESLAMHSFVTGTTGSGKSNTIYLLLSELAKRGKKFLVIESAKGEYKNIFGKNQAKVYGTNPKITQLLRINPFEFPQEIHLYEHIDRLVEVFNACWPMYAAMPAVLKTAIERAYSSCGWDLINSENKYAIFPTFDDILRELRDFIDISEYSQDTKGDYKGALETRLQSLTTGIIGQVFKGNPISDEELFNENIIIDLSRVGSSETKAMFMGLLILKLNEFRMSEENMMNSPLRHITVLEEAHNLLKRTSSEQSQESANLAGKSVEMISNSIAEMRTYGEGFIIADQSPAMLDMAAIRNTNTKIVMALPDKEDREVAGKAMGLKDEQIEEIAKLKKGEAIIHQRGWAEAVNCKINKYNGEENTFECEKDLLIKINKSESIIKILEFILADEFKERKNIDIEAVVKSMKEIQVNGYLLLTLNKLIEEFQKTGELYLWKAGSYLERSKLVVNLLGAKITDLEKIDNNEEKEFIANRLDMMLENIIDIDLKEHQDLSKIIKNSILVLYTDADFKNRESFYREAKNSILKI